MISREFVHVFVNNSDGLFLQHRDDKPGIYDPNMLCAFGGHVDPEDISHYEAAQRELLEETGLETALIARGITRKKTIDLRGNPIRKVVYGYEAQISTSAHVECHEGQGAVLVPFGSRMHKIGYAVTDIMLREMQRYYRDQFVFNDL